MNLGDLLEWLSAIVLSVAVFLWIGTVLTLVTVAVFLFYQAQCHSDRPIRLKSKKEPTSE